MLGSCEYIEWAAAERRKGVVLRLVGLARCQQLLAVNVTTLRDMQQGLGLGTTQAVKEGHGQEVFERRLVGRTEGKRRLAIARHRWENNIKMDVQEVGWGLGVD
jgi:hypothetical protein